MLKSESLMEIIKLSDILYECAPALSTYRQIGYTLKQILRFEKMLLTRYYHRTWKGAFFVNQREKEEMRQLWIARVCDLGESGLTQEKWCKSHNIAYSTLRYWLSKLKN